MKIDAEFAVHNQRQNAEQYLRQLNQAQSRERGVVLHADTAQAEMLTALAVAGADTSRSIGTIGAQAALVRDEFAEVVESAA